MGRKRVLDDVKKREVCALVTAGMSMTKVAKYVGCGRRTIQLERQADDDFDRRIRRAAMARDLNPREAMRRFAATHWRAAAWMLEREERQQAARTRAKSERQYTSSHLESLAAKIKHAVNEMVYDPFAAPLLVERIERLFLEATRTVDAVGTAKALAPPRAHDHDHDHDLGEGDGESEATEPAEEICAPAQQNPPSAPPWMLEGRLYTDENVPLGRRK